MFQSVSCATQFTWRLRRVSPPFIANTARGSICFSESQSVRSLPPILLSAKPHYHTCKTIPSPPFLYAFSTPSIHFPCMAHGSDPLPSHENKRHVLSHRAHCGMTCICVVHILGHAFGQIAHHDGKAAKILPIHEIHNVVAGGVRPAPLSAMGILPTHMLESWSDKI
jgi:hypothetical protein